MPPDPFGGMAGGAVATFELFRAYADAGFTERQALYLIACMLAVAAQPPRLPAEPS